MAQADNAKNAEELLKTGLDALKSNDADKAFQSLLEAFALAPEKEPVQTALFEFLSSSQEYELPPAFNNAIAKVLHIGRHDLQPLSQVIRNLYASDLTIEDLIDEIKDHPATSALSSEQTRHIQTIFSDPLTQLILARAINISPELEELITSLRRWHARAWKNNNLEASPAAEVPDLLPLIACQAFNTHYVYELNEGEEFLAAEIVQSTTSALPELQQHPLALAACYMSLADIFSEQSGEALEKLTEQAAAWPQAMQTLWTQQVINTNFEKVIAPNIQPLTQVPEMAPEQAVMSPFPRWQTTPLQEQQSLKQRLHTKFSTELMPPLEDQPADILFAGCASGQETIKLAKTIRSKNMLAMDNDIAQLAHTFRKAQEYGIENLHAALADLTQIGSLDASFDALVCSESLLYSADPKVLIKNLIALSKENSVFFFSLRSKRSDTELLTMQNYVKENELGASLENIRQFRRIIQELPYGHPLAKAADCPAYFSAAALYRYVFTSENDGYTPASLKVMLEECGLSFIGFENIPLIHKHKYAEAFPDAPHEGNLDNWEKLEEENPQLFSGTMQFWCHRAK